MSLNYGFDLTELCQIIFTGAKTKKFNKYKFKKKRKKQKKKKKGLLNNV